MKDVILAVSFGTSYKDSREKTIGAIERHLAAAFPQWEVRRAFTSKKIISTLKERDSLIIDNVGEALERAYADGVRRLVVQPTHMMGGFEYTRLMAELEKYKGRFPCLEAGLPLLSGESDLEAVANAVANAFSACESEGRAIVLMGHGTEAAANHVYEKFQKKLEEMGHHDYYIGTVEARPSLEDIAVRLKKAGIYKRVLLAPFMVVAGDHAVNDMAGEEETSWKSVLTKEGYEVECLLKGLGEKKEIQAIYAEHARAAVERCGCR
jgi:sirohydrochlorin cobaltochelatase